MTRTTPCYEVSLEDLLDDSRSIKLIRDKANTRKVRLSKNHGVKAEDIYNELNYFHMKLECSKKIQAETEACFNVPKPMLCSIERKSLEEELYRLKKLSKENQMIDFAVKLTRGTGLKQTRVQWFLKHQNVWKSRSINSLTAFPSCKSEISIR